MKLYNCFGNLRLNRLQKEAAKKKIMIIGVCIDFFKLPHENNLRIKFRDYSLQFYSNIQCSDDHDIKHVVSMMDKELKQLILEALVKGVVNKQMPSDKECLKKRKSTRC